MRDLESMHLYSQVGFFSQVPKDWEVSLAVVGDRFYLFFLKIMNWYGLLDTLGCFNRKIFCLFSKNYNIISCETYKDTSEGLCL